MIQARRIVLLPIVALALTACPRSGSPPPTAERRIDPPLQLATAPPNAPGEMPDVPDSVSEPPQKATPIVEAPSGKTTPSAVTPKLSFPGDRWLTVPSKGERRVHVGMVGIDAATLETAALAPGDLHKALKAQRGGPGPFEALKLTPKIPFSLEATPTMGGFIGDSAVLGPNKGWFVLRASSTTPKLSREVLAQVTDLGISVRYDLDRVRVLVTRLSTGALVDGAVVRIMDAEGGVFGVGETTPTSAIVFEGLRKTLTTRSPPFVVTAESGADRAFAVLDGSGLDGFLGLYAPGAEPPAPLPPAAVIVTDRTVYTPGNTIHIAGLVRARSPKEASPPKDTKISLALHDAGGHAVVKDVSATLTPSGTFSAKIAVPKDALIGLARIHGRLQDTVFGHTVELSPPRPAQSIDPARKTTESIPKPNTKPNDQGVTLYLDRTTFKPGEEATITIGSPFPRTRGLLMVERGGVINHRVLDFAGDTHTERITLGVEHIPNAHITALLLGTLDDQPRALHRSVQLRVDPASIALDASIEVGDAHALNVAVTDHQGQGVAAEVALFVVEADAAPDALPDPNRALKPSRTPGAVLWDSRGLIAPAVPNANMPHRHAITTSPFSPFDGDTIEPPRSRAATALGTSAYVWHALKTDSKGQLTHTLPKLAPDKAWRALAFVVGADGRVGRGGATLPATDPVLANLDTPETVWVGDRVRAEFIARNQSGAAQTLKLDAKGPGVTQPLDALEVGPRTTAQTRFDLAPKASKTSEVSVGFDIAGVKRRVSQPIVALQPVQDRRAVHRGQSGGILALPVSIPSDGARLEVALSGAPTLRLFDAVSASASSPFDGWTHTAWTLSLLALAGDALESGPLEPLATHGQRRDAMRALVERILSAQPGCRSSGAPQISDLSAVWLAHALLQAREAGINAPVGAYKCLLHRISKPMKDADTRAFAAFVRAQTEKRAGGLRASGGKLPTTIGLAYLYGALDLDRSGLGERNEASRERLWRTLKARKMDRNGGVVMGEPDGSGGDMKVSASATAAVLDVLLQVEPKHALVPKLTRGLWSLQRPDGLWETPEATFRAASTLGRALRHRKKQPETAVSFWFGDDYLGRKRLGPKEIFWTDTDLPGGKKLAELVLKAEGPVFFRAALVTPGIREAIAAPGVALWTRLSPKKTPLKVGDGVNMRVMVRFDADSGPAALSVALPTGFHLLGAGVDRCGAFGEGVVHRGRVHFFAPSVKSGVHACTLSLEATRSGDLVLPPSFVEALDAPALRAQTQAGRLLVQD